MSERIVERVVRMRVNDEGLLVVRGDDEETGMREEVVRCRDCANAIERRATLADEPRTFYECEFFDLSEVEPDGFCKWGERKEDR